MAISINSCLKPSSASPPIPPNPSPLLSQRLPCKKDSRTSLHNQCMSVAAACVIISGFPDIAESRGPALAADQLMPVTAATSRATQRKVLYRWTDQIRPCPKWRENVLENVMPENLPRRSGRQRTDGYVADQQTAPPVRFDKSCYSL